MTEREQEKDQGARKAGKPGKPSKPKRFPWLTKRLVVTIVVIYAVIAVAAFLWTTFVSGWGNDLWMMWLW